MTDFLNFKDKYKGQVCTILGNSPSLSDENLSLMQGKVFIVNKGFLATDILKLTNYDFYVVSDPTCASENYDQIQNLNCIKFISSAIIKKKHLKNLEGIVFTRSDKNMIKDLPSDLSKGWPRVGSVIIDAVIIAYYLGFKEINLLGVGLNYSSSNTHFYKDTVSENSRKGQMDNNLKKILKICKMLRDKFAKQNVLLYNNSSEWKYTEILTENGTWHSNKI